MQGDYRVLPNGADGWKVQRDGNQQATARFGTQAEAWSDCKTRARNSGAEAFLHNRQGQIRERNTYGHDPRNIKG